MRVLSRHVAASVTVFDHSVSVRSPGSVLSSLAEMPKVSGTLIRKLIANLLRLPRLTNQPLQGSSPRPTDYEPLFGARLAKMAYIDWKPTDLAVAGTGAVRLRYDYKSPPVAGVTPG